jgi:hypothetical protein
VTSWSGALRELHAIETQTALPALVDGQACLCLRISAAEYNAIEDYGKLAAAVLALPPVHDDAAR